MDRPVIEPELAALRAAVRRLTDRENIRCVFDDFTAGMDIHGWRIRWMKHTTVWTAAEMTPDGPVTRSAVDEAGRHIPSPDAMMTAHNPGA